MAGFGGSEMRAPIFNSENYEFWSIRIRTIFKSHGLWEFVEKGIERSDSKEEDESDAKKKEKEGSSNAMTDIDVIEVQEVVASLKSFAQRLERHSENKTERAFASLIVNPKHTNSSGNQNNRYQKNWKPKFKKWDQKPTYQTGKQFATANGGRNPCRHCDKYHYGECFLKGKPKCHSCGKIGHIVKDYNNKKNVQQLNYATQVSSTPTMFYASNAVDMRSIEYVWYVDSGCSNHMTGREDVLVDIDRSRTAKVEMGTGQLVDVVGKWTLVVDTKMGRRYIREVMLVSSLKENLFNVGQMMEHGYFLIFLDNKAEIYDDCTLSHLVAKVPMKGNKIFPLKL
ncbi:uncharacterized protein [Pyrus communis]|uniref:uncharacterized protein n=1 Tax=Pyrus communis TaxID=23211 RepID=UPI0035C12CF4